MRVFPGEVVGPMRDNGAGKSTLVKIIAGNFPPSHGEIRFDGKAVHFARPIDARAVRPNNSLKRSRGLTRWKNEK
jgi:simple sugar transport system ATP-binding protein